MSALILVGAQWGDEGKGKIVDYLSAQANWVVRYQGGNNAGHTVVVEDKTYKLSLIPSGILHKNCCCALGAGVVVDPEVLITEMEKIKQAGFEISPTNFIIDRDAHLILQYHKAIDNAREAFLGENKIGTTGRGIGPAYEDRAARLGIKFAELNELDNLKTRLVSIIKQRNDYLSLVLKSDTVIDFNDVWQSILKAKEELLQYVGNVGLNVDTALKNGKKVLLEGAQGTLLDQIHGTFPFVTSSNTIAGAATTGIGIGPNKINYVLGIVKAYTTRVGSGPFPTELFDQVGDTICKNGSEFGTVTGRKRRCGWLDAVALKRAVRLNGLCSIAVTKLDVISRLEKLKICIGYKLDGKQLDDLPALSSELARVEPQYIELDGWQEDISTITNWNDLPNTTKAYLKKIEEVIECPISILSVGAERNSTFFMSDSEVINEFLGR